MKVAFTRLIAISVLAFPLTVLSQAHVSLEFQELESPIVLPDDGWYQIQTNSTVSSGVTVCEGVRSCDVTPGYYMIINHTAGTRRPVSVRSMSDEPSSTSEPIQVSGNTISWPSDSGWHQVQSAVDYSSACEGGTSCVVSDGLYVVINHTTGVRYENIRVGESGGGSGTVEGAASVTVEGNVINWPLDGWYQVQNSMDYTTACEGGASCEVSPGTYVVINHTTGERFEGITVGGAPVDTTTDMETPLVATAENAMVAGLPYKSARVWLNNVVTGRQAYTGEKLESYFDFAIEPSLVESLTSGATNECVGGGTVDYLREVSGVVVAETFEFANCVLPEGSISGRIVLDTRQSSKVFDVSVIKPTGNAVLSGQSRIESSTNFEANPLCGEDTISTRDAYSLSLYNSTLTETTETGLESHYYATLSQSQIDFIKTDCAGLVEYSFFGGSASYSHTLGDQITLMEITKGGAVAPDNDLLDSLTGRGMGTLNATVDTSDGDTVTVEIMAADAPGSSLDITISQGVGSVEFSEDLNFQDLSTP